MATKTVIVIGNMSDGATNAETQVADEGFQSSFDVYVRLRHLNLQSGTADVTTLDGLTHYTEGPSDDYVMDNPHGCIKVLSTGTMLDAANYLIDYHYNEPTLAWKIQNAIDAEGSNHQVYTTWCRRRGVAIIIYTPP